MNFSTQSAHDPKIDHSNLAVIEDKEVASVEISVEKPIDHHHVKKSVGPDLHDLDRIDSFLLDGFPIVKANPIKTFQHQDLIGTELSEDLRNSDLGKATSDYS